jgi:hypothetical protein
MIDKYNKWILFKNKWDEKNIKINKEMVQIIFIIYN